MPPFSPESNAAKLAIMEEPYFFADGSAMKIQGGFDDVGDGQTMNLAVQFVSSAEAQGCGLWGVRGKSEAKGNRTPTIRGGKMQIHNWTVDTIGTASAKDDLFARLQIEGWGPRAVHFPSTFEKRYFDSLTATTLKTLENGATYWDDKKGNEALDCLIYAYARMLMLRKNESWFDALLMPPVDQARHHAEMIEPIVQWNLAKKADRSYQSVSWQTEMKGKRPPDDLVVRRFKPTKASAEPRLPRPRESPLPVPPGAPPAGRVQSTPGNFRPPAAAAPHGEDAPVRYGRIGKAPSLGWR